MHSFVCTCCTRNVFFENDQCGQCGSLLGYVPAEGRLVAFVQPVAGDDVWWRRAGDDGPALRPCRNRIEHAVCNWMIDAGDGQPLCRSCRLNLTIPDLGVPGHVERWADVEQAKRRLMFKLLQLGLDVQPRIDDNDNLGLGVRILAPQAAGEAVLTGHAQGVITINLQEADDVHREATRVAFGEPWRTLLGHLRHEASHYLLHRWIAGHGPALDLWRQTFGDERQDYAQAQGRYHAQGPTPGWPEHFITAYASVHPHEDWAETCAHLLLVADALETAASWGLSLASRVARTQPGIDVLDPQHTRELVLTHWLPIAQFLNAMNRSLGLKDSYPFLMPGAVVHKMAVAAQLLQMVTQPKAPPLLCDHPLAELQPLLARRSVGPRGLRPPGPTPEQWQQAAELALRAPDHQGLRPFRFVHVGADERAALGELFAQAARDQGRDEDGVALARERAASGPGLLAVLARIRDDLPEVPAHEQWLCVGAAVMNLLNALHLMGYGAKVLGGGAARAEVVRRAFCQSGEQLACWVVAGSVDGDAGLSDRERPAGLISDWQPPL